MSKFIKIINNADDIDRRFLEKLGISSKRDDESTIGQFGSGAKLAPIAALRKGIRWITVAKDKDGPYCLEYIAKDVDGIETVFYKYDDVEKESSFTIDAGVLSWDEDFQIFREAFANAVDSGSEYSIEYVDDVAPYVDGKVCVYLTAHPALIDIVSHFNRYFLFRRTPLVSTEYGDIYGANSVHQFRLYNKSVLVLEREFEFESGVLDKRSYDWGFKNVDLNEERRMKHSWQAETLIARLLTKLPDTPQAREFVNACIKNEPYEFFKVLNGYSFSEGQPTSSIWGEEWLLAFGDKVIPVGPSNMAEVIADNLRGHGYRARFVSAPMAMLLYNSGIQKPEDLLGDKSKIKVVQCPQEHVAVLEHAIRTVSRYDERLEDYKISVMDDDNNYGLAVIGQGEEEIFVSLVCLQLGFRQVVLTLIHELDHVTTGFLDSDFRNFRNAADQRIVDLVIAAGYNDDIYVDHGVVYIDLNYLAALGSLEYEVLTSDFGSLLRIGDSTFFVDVSMTGGKGVMSVRDNKLAIEDNAISVKTKIQKV